MMAKSPAAVAAAFSNSSRPTSPGESCWAAMPEPMTTAARKALPRNSATRRRHRARSFTVRPCSSDRRCRSAAGGEGPATADGRSGRRRSRPPPLAAVGGAARARCRVGQHRVDLPGLPRRGRPPRPCPVRRSSRSPAPRPRASFGGQPGRGGRHLVGVSTSTPRWLRARAGPSGFSMRTSLSGGSAMAKLA